MRRNIVWIALVFGVALTTPAYAQEGLYYPGSVWSSTGTLAPFEPNNVISINHVEQGVAYKGAELFFQNTTGIDSSGLAWNRRTENGVGIRFTQSVKTGMIRAGMAYLVEHRFPVQQTRTNTLALYVQAWFGWHQAAPPYVPPSPYLGGK